VPDQSERGEVEMLDQATKVGQEMAHPIGLHLLRLAGQVVPAHVRGVYGVIGAEAGELVAPQEPELREAV